MTNYSMAIAAPVDSIFAVIADERNPTKNKAAKEKNDAPTPSH